MVDIPTLNKSVNEFRTIIAENIKGARELEKTKRAREAKADAELQEKIGQLSDKIEKAGEKAKDTDKATLELLQQERADRVSQKKRDEELKVLARKTLGVTTRRFKQQQAANEEAKGARQRLEDLRSQLQSQGVDIKANKNFQKLELEVEKKERKARLKSKPLLSSLKEQGKDSLEKTAKVFNRFLGPRSFFGKQIGGLFGLLNRKIISPLTSGLTAALKGGVFVLSLLALVEFLNSDLWKNLKDKIIPFLKSSFDTALSLLESLKFKITEVINAFSEEGFSAGFEELTKQVFGEESKIKRVLDNVLLPVLVFIGDTLQLIADLVDPPVNKDGTIRSRLDIIMENIGTFSIALALLGLALAPSAIFGTAFFLGKWTVIPVLAAAFALFNGKLIGLAAQIRGISVPRVPNDITTVKPVGTSRASGPPSARVTGITGTSVKISGGGGANVASNTNVKPPVASNSNKPPSARSGGGAFKGLGFAVDSLESFGKKLPKNALKFIANSTNGIANFLQGGGAFGSIGKRILPGLNLAFAGIETFNVLQNPSLSTEEKASQIAGIAARTIGANVGFFLGSLAGFPFSPFGSLLTGMAGAVGTGVTAGYFAENLTRSFFGLDPLPFPRELEFLLGEDGMLKQGFLNYFGFTRAANAAQFTPQGREFGGGLTEGMSPQTGQMIGTKSPLANLSSMGMGRLSSLRVGTVASNDIQFGNTAIPLIQPNVQNNVAPVSVDNSSVQNVTNVVRALNRSGDGFTGIALQNYGVVGGF